MRMLMLACALVLAFPGAAAANFEALLWAARTKQLEIVRSLLADGADPDPPYESYTGYTPLMFAAQNGDTEMTRLLLEAGAGTERRDHNGERALEWATSAYYLHTLADVPGCVRLLLEAGSPPDSDDRLGISPLMHASEYGGHGEIMRLLLAAGADPNRVDHSNSTALHRAAWQDGEAVALLLAAGADPDIRESALGGAPLHRAASGGAVGNARLLLAAGADTEARYHRGLTPLMMAADAGSEGVVRALIASGADVDARDDDGMTATLATLAGKAEAAKRRAAAAVLAQYTSELDRVFAAMIAAGFDEAAQHLLERGADIDGLDHRRRSPIGAAAGRAEPDWFERLLASGADLGRHGGEAIGAAAGAAHDDRIERLLSLGVPVDETDRLGATALLRAAASGHVGTVELLIAHGANRDPRDDDGAGATTYMADARRPLEEAIARAEGSRAYIDVSAERTALARLLEAHARIERLLAG